MIRADDAVADVWRALRRSAASAGCALRLHDVRETPWWSATFSGRRITLVAHAHPAAPLDDWLAALGEADLPLPDRFVADGEVDARRGVAGETEMVLTLLVLDA